MVPDDLLTCDELRGAFPAGRARNPLFLVAGRTATAAQVPATSRHRWALAAVGGWLDALPPFWQTCAFIAAQSFPQAALALSIATAGIGPIAGIGLILVFGVVNMVTIAALAEAVARNGAIRYGNAFLGRVAADYLGRSGSVVMTLAAGAYVFLGEIAALVGLAKTLASFIAVPAVVVAAALFAVNVYRLARQSLKLSFDLSVVLAAVDIGLLLLLSVLAFTHLQAANLRWLPLGGGHGASLRPPLLQALLGVLLTAYYGHLFVGQAARVVLPRDPSGRALIWGSVAAFAGITVVFAIWVLAVSGAVAPPVLARSASTVLVPLAAQLGPVAQVLGAPIVIILLGLASIRCADVLFNLVRERLPAPRPRSILGRRGRLVLALSPVLVAFLVAEWVLLTGAGSFARLMSMAGVLTVSLFAGILPALLLVASRRKGERVPTAVYPVLGHPAVVGGIYLLFLSIILLHGLVIWQAPVERALALALAVLVVALTAWMVRGGAFRPRAVVELRDDRCADGQGTFAVTAAGRPLVARVHFDLPEGARTCAAAMGAVPRFAQLRSATFHLNLSATHARELKVWAHQVTAEGESEGLPAVVHVTDSAGTQRFDLRRRGGQVVVPLHHADCRVLITMARPLDGLQENRG